MKHPIVALISGMTFSVGLTISGMVNPAKVKGFLDLFGNWDYSLAFVMGGAVILNLLSFRYFLRRKPFFSSEFFLPTKTQVDKRLVIGSILFGIGWGLIGVCPGPALVNVVKLEPGMFVFISMMLVGMLTHKFIKS